MLKMNLETNINNINYLRYMEQKEKEKENEKRKKLLEREQTTSKENKK